MIAVFNMISEREWLTKSMGMVTNWVNPSDWHHKWKTADAQPHSKTAPCVFYYSNSNILYCIFLCVTAIHLQVCISPSTEGEHSSNVYRLQGLSGKGKERGIPSQLYNWMHSTETCLPHLTQPLWIREVQGAALIDIHVFGVTAMAAHTHLTIPNHACCLFLWFELNNLALFDFS